MTKKDKGTPCYFLQTGAGNIVMRLHRPDTGAATALTLHQIVAMDVPTKEIPLFDLEKFKRFYSDENCLGYLFRPSTEDKNYLEWLK
jgi:hypothetical protein